MATDRVQAAVTKTWERAAPQQPDVAHRFIIPAPISRERFTASALALPFVESVGVGSFEIGPGFSMSGYAVFCRSYRAMQDGG